ncbi:MAG: GreA/GreB family elongation factor [Acidobacteriota bacterium]|nr:GreA/GreB family elongation factor [Acidobacteriota bacterium]
MTTETIDRLDEILSLASAPAEVLSADHRGAINSILESAQDEDALFKLAARAQAALDQSGKNLRGLYTAAVYQELNGQDEDAGKGFVQLARELARQNDWEGARELALRALPLWPDNRVVRLLISCWAKLDDPERQKADQDLAEELCPTAPDLLWFRAQAADRDGQTDRASVLACEALKRYIVEKDGERAEEPLLRVLESTRPDVNRELVRMLPRMASAGLRDLLDTTLELADDNIARFGLHQEMTQVLERILLKRPGFEDLRSAYVESLVNSLGGTAEIKSFVTDCGLADPEVALEQALARFREMFNYRPGAFVEHHSFGVGRIFSLEGKFLVIDFERKPQHRMALEIAVRSLHPLSSECLRVARFSEPERIEHERENDPVGLLVRALSDLGGEAKVRDLRDCLAGQVIHDDEWSAWWKRARDCAAEDDRIDTSQVFRQIYRLPTDEEEDLELPPLPEKSGLRGAVSLVGRLLRHHPEAEERAREAYLPEIVKRAESATPAEVLPAVPLLMKWAPERREHWADLGSRALRQEPGVAGGATAEEQEQLLTIGLESTHWDAAAISSIASRFPAVRHRALDALRERLGDEADKRLRELALEHTGWPATRLALVRLALAGGIDRPELTPWDLLAGVIGVLSSNAAPKLRLAALDMLDTHGPLAARLRDAEPDEESVERIRRGARGLSGSESGVEPLVFLLSYVGHEEVAERLRSDHSATEELDPIAIHFDPGVILMSRATYNQNVERIHELEDLLSNDLPKMIAHARSLGDLSENAEYHDAKERQGIADANLRTLRKTMESARAIEDLHFPDDTVVVGTEVAVRDLDSGEERTFWLLGQGDSAQDPNVINYLAPVGQALVGKRAGEVAQFETGAGTQRLEVVSVRRRLP